MIRRWLGRIGGLRGAGRRTNVALLVVLIGAALTGILAFAAGTPIPARLATVVHGLLGLAVVLLVPWKTVIVRRASALRLASLALVALIAVCIASGLVEVFGGYGVLWRLSPMQVHVGSAVLAAPLLAWHLVRHRRQRLRRRDLSRRTLLRTGVLAVGVAATYGTLEGIGRLAGAASASRIATGSHYLSPDTVPATMWLFDQVPALPADYRIHVAGNELTVADLASRSTTLAARLDCTSGWYSDAEWTAVSLDELLSAEQVAAAASIEVVSMTGYRRRFPADEVGSLWLATAYQGVPLRPAYGAPVRLVAPQRRGFWWVKWVASVELSDQPAWSQSPFPLQ
ncbi:MAG TPA: molybdopterin-dependent oxidoreductase [Propionibacteriaceae bacterium]|nr:molybdopterin-dependent oxidoreductase [Propionibacteriaceae bacterium]